jgi:hypothetical protein
MTNGGVGSCVRGKAGGFYRPGRACRILCASPQSKREDGGPGRGRQQDADGGWRGRGSGRAHGVGGAWRAHDPQG